MANKRLDAILNNVLAQSGFLQQSQFFGSPDPDNIQMTAIANRVGLEIMQFYPWEILRKDYTITLAEGTTKYNLPTDLSYIIMDSSWETDGSRKVDDHIADNVWYQYKFSSLTAGGIIRARQVGDELEVIEPFDGGEISFAYATEHYALVAGSIPATEFSTDQDYFVLDDQVLTLGIQAHWQQTKQMPTYQEHMMNYMRKMNEAIGRDGVRNTIGGREDILRRSPYTKLWIS